MVAARIQHEWGGKEPNDREWLKYDRYITRHIRPWMQATILQAAALLAAHPSPSDRVHILPEDAVRKVGQVMGWADGLSRLPMKEQEDWYNMGDEWSELTEQPARAYMREAEPVQAQGKAERKLAPKPVPRFPAEDCLDMLRRALVDHKVPYGRICTVEQQITKQTKSVPAVAKSLVGLQRGTVNGKWSSKRVLDVGAILKLADAMYEKAGVKGEFARQKKPAMEAIVTAARVGLSAGARKGG